MRDPEMFKYDVRVRERMLRGGRITVEEVNSLLQALPDVESECEDVLLPQPALDLAAAAAAVAATRQAAYSPAPALSEAQEDESQNDDEAEA
jgi:ribosomal protein L12E/L44/L45/RPP1/RPP2